MSFHVFILTIKTKYPAKNLKLTGNYIGVNCIVVKDINHLWPTCLESEI